MENDFKYKEENTQTFAANILTIHFLGQGAGFNKEFLASAEESGFTAVVSSFIFLQILVVCELIALSQCAN